MVFLAFSVVVLICSEKFCFGSAVRLRTFENCFGGNDDIVDL